MNTNKIIIAGIVGGVVAFILGFLIYGMALSNFFASNAGSASGVMRADDEMLWIPMIVGHLTWGLLFAVIFGRWAQISTFSTGAQAGALIGFLIACTFDFINLATTHISTLTAVIVDLIVMTIVSAIVGGVVGLMLGRGTS